MTQPSTTPALAVLDPAVGHDFQTPKKCIHDGDDVTFFLASRAYADIMTFIFQLNTAMIPRVTKQEQGTSVKQEQGSSVKEWTLQDPDVVLPPVVQGLAKLLEALTAIIDEAPPDPGPRRFGNVSFRTWHEIVRARTPALLAAHLPAAVLAWKSSSGTPAQSELEAYFTGSFGSAQRLDYGTGHELSFLAFLGCLWKLAAFPASPDGATERALVLGVVEPYLALIRRLILTYTLEPAGSHGVWGLDDHSFAPYIFGSAQLCPPIASPADIAAEGSLASAPPPADVSRAATQRERARNMYFSALGFIYDVKTGPFWEHSPILYDVSGVKAGWAKINKGMIKMYNAEVLAKFPVVQHFPFGSLFEWARDPAAREIRESVHTAAQPKAVAEAMAPLTVRQTGPREGKAGAGVGGVGASAAPMTAAPWAAGPGTATPMTAAPWATKPGSATPTTAAPWATTSRAPPPPPATTSRAPPPSSTRLPPPGAATPAPWATSTRAPPPASQMKPEPQPPQPSRMPPPGAGTAAPWARGGASTSAAGAGNTQPEPEPGAGAGTRAPWAERKG